MPNAILANVMDNIKSKGGLEVGSEDDPFWFKVNGILKLDQRFYISDKGKRSSKGTEPGTYHSGAQVRGSGLSLSGGIGKNWSYALGLGFDAAESKAEVEDASLTYKGFKQLGDNFVISIGHINPGFCLENTTSGTWHPFMEKSLTSSAFAPCPGLGVSMNTHGDHFSITAAISQPPAADKVYDATKTEKKRSDRWNTSARVTFAPIADTGKVLQLGVSGHFQDDAHAGIEFTTAPETKSRNTTTLLNTTVVNGDTNTRIAAKNHSTFDFELTAQNGPFTGEVEYQFVNVNRGNNAQGISQGDNLSFHGYHAQIAYVLTGETRSFKKSSGTFGKIEPTADSGAWEVATRYSFINLNDKDITGGTAHNTTISLSWYANNNIRVIGEFVNSKQQRLFSAPLAETIDKRNLQSIGLRLQAVF